MSARRFRRIRTYGGQRPSGSVRRICPGLLAVPSPCSATSPVPGCLDPRSAFIDLDQDGSGARAVPAVSAGGPAGRDDRYRIAVGALVDHMASSEGNKVIRSPLSALATIRARSSRVGRDVASYGDIPAPCSRCRTPGICRGPTGDTGGTASGGLTKRTACRVRVIATRSTRRFRTTLPVPRISSAQVGGAVRFRRGPR